MQICEMEWYGYFVMVCISVSIHSRASYKHETAFTAGERE
jgi:hypothetical protein